MHQNMYEILLYDKHVLFLLSGELIECCNFEAMRQSLKK